jgi:Flp pilus assembly protein TadG
MAAAAKETGRMKNWLADQRGNMAEFAFVVPLLILVMGGMVTLGMTAWVATSANTIAQRSARAASVVQGGAGARAGRAVHTSAALAEQFTYGDYTMTIVNAGSGPGDVITVRVVWQAPNWVEGLAALFPIPGNDYLQGSAVASYRVEGW